jgi:hypothetical protein
VRIELCDLKNRALGPFDLTAMFAFDGGQMKRTLLGLSGGAFDRFELTLDYSGQGAWLKEKVP